MKKTRIFALLCTLFLLAGCTAPADPTAPPNSGTAPESSANVGFHYAMVKSSAQDRCAATSMGKMVEAENGYYYVVKEYIYYADKQNMSNWILVCNQPDCEHSVKDNCPALVAGSANYIWGRDGKLYAVMDTGLAASPDLISESAGDGSASHCVLSDKNSPLNSNNASVYSTEANASGVCFNVVEMQPDGFWDSYLYFIDEHGTHKVPYAKDFPDIVTTNCGNRNFDARGDMTMQLVMEFPGAGADVGAGAVLYRVSPECMEKLELPEGCSYYGAYLSGDTMIHYHPGDGFYKLDYYGGTEEKIAEATYTDGFGYCLDGEFLVETTVNWQSTAKECKLRYFDGTDWTEVPLLEAFTPETNLRIVSLTSDTLFLEEMSTALYMVKLGDNQLVKCMDYPARS